MGLQFDESALFVKFNRFHIFFTLITLRDINRVYDFFYPS